MEQTHVLLAVDGILDHRRADIVFSRVGVQALTDVVVADPMGANMVSSAAHIGPGMQPLMRPGSRRRRMPFVIPGIYFTPLRLRFLQGETLLVKL
ncbi:unnamed protein product [Calypogeia fissa]